MAINKTMICSSNERDTLNNQGIKVGVIEIKGGTDPAGALERYGAAKKSFEEAFRINPEVNTRIENDSTISTYFNLTEILTEQKLQYKNFIQEVFSLLQQ
ncbi:hypothetical protein IQ247_28660 [Plectonema cf. radiosum LEGE 06105]|uniref:Uncharacterized protein n=1 Tax=Plectonema cf. radiosum LEGE 06105 TaxID=945769 RepID=A0A8J7F6L0_9CYAN|nr:hypothetical protein [Plectonema radiosum]MBE9216583.1 hypothetical protein [Plectonema cf. radiosum LEGE 06105]